MKKTLPLHNKKKMKAEMKRINAGKSYLNDGKSCMNAQH